MKTSLVFGTFDAIHPGHEYFLEQAHHYGQRLVVVVARDRFVNSYKNKKPLHDEISRLHFIQKHKLVTEACLADEELGTFSVLDKIRPDYICLGHDQDALAESLKSWMSASGNHYHIKRIKPFERHKYSSTLLNRLKRHKHSEQK
ncbi:MAG: adenylyltransferase/cytidyltransferase family protein [Spirochaetales bacterium]|nr:adenylyltransferase/cytidyltransferase family protein [Spirochaetales bacterium]